jgi:hypothetical protein
MRVVGDVMGLNVVYRATLLLVGARLGTSQTAGGL